MAMWWRAGTTTTDGYDAALGFIASRGSPATENLYPTIESQRAGLLAPPFRLPVSENPYAGNPPSVLRIAPSPDP